MEQIQIFVEQATNSRDVEMAVHNLSNRINEWFKANPAITVLERKMRIMPTFTGCVYGITVAIHYTVPK